MKKTFLIIFTLIILIATFVTAQRYENNFMKYGTINNGGNLVVTSTPVNNVGIRGFVCSSANCASVSGNLWGGSILNSGDDFIQLVYPTTLQSSQGYGVYMYKNGYIPYEVNADWWGTCSSCDPVGPYDNYLTKKEVCVVNINDFDVEHNGGNIDVDVNVQSPIFHTGPLDYVPPSISDHYEVDVDVNLEVVKNGTAYYTETKAYDIPFSENKDVHFSFPVDRGNYSIYVYTTTNDDKCISYSKDEEEENKTIGCQTNLDCSYLNNACSSAVCNLVTESCEVDPMPIGFGDSCTSNPNSCGQTNSGTKLCDGTCDATTPSDPGYLGDACTSSPNSCGETNNGTTQCDGTCDATTSADPIGYGDLCTSSANSCGDTNNGTILCDGLCSAIKPAERPGWNNACNSAPNSCGQINPGFTDCFGICDATTPADPGYLGDACTSAPNSCGDTNNGTKLCDGTCSATTSADPGYLGDACGNACFNDGAKNCDNQCIGATPLPSNYGDVCTSLPNSCGNTNNGTILCDGTCSATTPPNPPGYGSSCTSNPNSCGDTNSGTKLCDGTCDAVMPAERSIWNNACNSTPNSCGQFNSGFTNCNGICNAIPPSDPGYLGDACGNACFNDGAKNCDNQCIGATPLPSNYGDVCTSLPNSCGNTNNGTILCDGSCSAKTPSNPPGLGHHCTSSPNSCGDVGHGTRQCDGTCSATTPAERSVWNKTCTSHPNSCGQTRTGITDCHGSCSVHSPPPNPPGYGNPCTSLPNSCGDTNPGTIQCDGTCDAVTPADPGYLGDACTSSANSCGDTNNGTKLCDGSCSATIPSDPGYLGDACGNVCFNDGAKNCDNQCIGATPLPSNYGNSCTSSANSCGQTNNGTTLCDGSCDAITPPNPPGYGSSCTSNPNSCGDVGHGTKQCDGTCDAVTPADPGYLGDACGNVCFNDGALDCAHQCIGATPLPSNYGDPCTVGIGMCQASGTYDCNGVCNAVPGKPFDEVCNGLDDDCDNIIDNGGNTLCDDGVYCNGPEICAGVLGCQAGSSIDCSSYNLSGISTCAYSPDNKPYTFDYFTGFTSVCNEDPDGCTVGVVNLTHTCDVGCGASCDKDSDCDDLNKYTKDVCSSSSCSCENIPIRCFEDYDCDDSNILTDDFCIKAGTVDSYCENKYIIDLLPRKKFLISQIRTNQLVYDEVQAGDQFFVDLNFENIGRRDTRYATIRITVSELGISRRLGPFSGPEVGEAMSRGLYVEIPKNAAPGVYTVRISLSDYNGIRRTRHRDFRIVK